jgi:hypothetical protein
MMLNDANALKYKHGLLHTRIVISMELFTNYVMYITTMILGLLQVGIRA